MVIMVGIDFFFLNRRQMQIKSHVLLHEKLVHFKLNMQDSELFAASMPNYPVKIHYVMCQ